jgi:hypothetical protein
MEPLPEMALESLDVKTGVEADSGEEEEGERVRH